MRLFAENELVQAGIETVYGTAEALAGADAIQCDIELVPHEANQKVREFSRAYHGARPVILTEEHRSCRLTNIELAGSGSADTAPIWTRIMRACAWQAVTTATETTFNPLTRAVDGLTINPILDTEQFQMIGSRGSASFRFAVDEFPTMTAAMKGGWVDPQTLGALPVPDYSAWQIPEPVNCDNTAAINIGGELYPFYELTIDQNAEINVYCIPGEPGMRIEKDAHDIKGTVKLQAKQITDHDIFAMVRSNAPQPVAMEHGTQAGFIVGVNGGAVQFLNPRPSTYKKELAWEMDMLWLPTGAGENEINIYTK